MGLGWLTLGLGMSWFEFAIKQHLAAICQTVRLSSQWRKLLRRRRACCDNGCSGGEEFDEAAAGALSADVG